MSEFINADCLEVMAKYPLTRIELKIRANKVRKQRRKNND